MVHQRDVMIGVVISERYGLDFFGDIPQAIVICLVLGKIGKNILICADLLGGVGFND